MEVNAKDAQDNKAMGILAYLGILVLVPIFAAKAVSYTHLDVYKRQL